MTCSVDQYIEVVPYLWELLLQFLNSFGRVVQTSTKRFSASMDLSSPSLVWALAYVFGVVVISSILALLGYALYIAHLRKLYAHIPGPPITSFLKGNIDEFKKCTEEGKSIDQIFFRWHMKYGKIVATWFYHVLFVGVADPDLIKDLIINQNLPKSPPAYEPISSVYGERVLGGGLATEVNHQKWAKRRKVFNPAFHRSSLKEMMGVFNASTDLFIDKLLQKADGKTEIVMVEEFARAALDVICKVAFGSDFNIINDENCQFTRDVSTLMVGMQEASFEPPGYWLNPRKWEKIKNTRKAIKSIRETGKRIIEERQLAISRGEQVPNDILQRTLAIAEEDPTADIEDLLDEFVTFFIAGHETTANKLAFCLMELCDPDHIDIIKRLEQEVFEVLGDRKTVHFDDLAKMHHIGETLKETLRMYPSATGTIRISQKDQLMDGLLVPAGTNIILSSFVMGRHPDYWKNAEEFNPLRFEQEESEKRSHYTYFPFSLGPRNCIGQHFAQIEAKILLSRFLQTFQFKAVPGQTKEILDRLTIRPRDGVIVTLKKRQNP